LLALQEAMHVFKKVLHYYRYNIWSDSKCKLRTVNFFAFKVGPDANN